MQHFFMTDCRIERTKIISFTFDVELDFPPFDCSVFVFES